MGPGAAAGAAPLEAAEPLATRLRRRALDPAMLSNPPVAAAFCLLRAYHLIAPLPYWFLVAVVLCGGSLAILSAALWGANTKRWHVPVFVSVNMAVITVVAYATGWGPILSIGFIFGSGSALQLFGAQATRHALRATFVCMSLGQAAIALGWAPTLVHQPLVHGLAGLSLLGTLLTIALLGRVTAAREQMEDEVRQSERRFKALVSNAADIIMVVGPDGLLHYVSPAFERILGISATPYYEQSTGDFIHPEDLERINDEFVALARDPEAVLRTRLRIQDSTGAWRHFEATVSDRSADPDVRGIVGNLHDITDLLEAHERFRSAFEDAPIGMALASPDGVILRANRAYGAILGVDPETIVGRTISGLTHPDDRVRTEEEIGAVLEGGDGYEIEKRLVHADGHEVWAMVHVTCVRDAVGRPLYLIGQIQDVTEQRTMRERLAHAAIHDPLTGLPNRVLFMDRLQMALGRAERRGHRVAVAFLDLDRFKLVNDGLGHSAGDELLEAVAERLSAAVRSEDTVARFGGDEFTVLWEDLEHEDEAVAVARRILEELQRPFELAGAPVFVTASVGVAVADGSASATSMLRDADTAMYLAKEAGRGRVEVFDGKSHAVALESLHVINELHSALNNEDFRLHYQPIVDLRTGSVVATEALVRWQHPQRGLLAPGLFVPIAEECGLIVPLGAWVLEESCRQTARWNRIGEERGLAPVEVHVNISPRQLTSPDFVDTVQTSMAASGISPEALCLEITESTLMHDEKASAAALRSLRALGVRISIDDFGTGYSSLSYLKHFPIDSLKVDRTFVDGLGEESDDSVIVSAVIALAHSLGLTAVAEGVETDVALRELCELGCDRVQGYLLGRPKPADELEDLLWEPALRVAQPAGSRPA